MSHALGARHGVAHFDDLAVRGDRVYWTENGDLFTTRIPQPEVPAGPEADGPPLWARRYDLTPPANPGNEAVGFEDVRLLADGSAVVIGSSGPVGIDLGDGAVAAYDHFVAKLSEAGDPVWSRQLTPRMTQFSCLGVTADQTIVAVANDPIADPTSNETYALAIDKYRPDGTLLSETRESGGDWYQFKCNVDPGGNLFLFSTPGWMAKKDAGGGDVWRKRLGSFHATTQLVPVNVAVSPGGAGLGFVAAAFLSGRITIDGVTYGAQLGVESSPNTSIVVRILDDGKVGWVHPFRSDVVRVALDALGRVLVLGRGSPDTGNGLVPVPRANDSFSYLLWLDPQGNTESFAFLDGSASDVAIANDGSIYLLASFPDRPFYFDPPYAPGNYDYGVLLAKLDPRGMLLAKHNFSPQLVAGAPNGYYSAPGRIAVATDRVIVAGSVSPCGLYPGWAVKPGDPDVWDAYAARFAP
jgi:hypothetical protein